MSYGTYDNQSPLNQQFNPTTGTSNQPGSIFTNAIGNAMGNQMPSGGIFGNLFKSVGNNLVNNMFGGQTPNSELGRKLFELPGAPQTPQQRVDESQQGGGILKLRQPPGGQPGIAPGGPSGKSGPGGKYMTGGPAIRTMPDQNMYGGGIGNPGDIQMPNPDNFMQTMPAQNNMFNGQ